VIKNGSYASESLAFYPDGERFLCRPFLSGEAEVRDLATGALDCKIRLWDAATGQSLWLLSGHYSAVTKVAFSPDGKYLASSSDDGSVILWSVSPCALIREHHEQHHWIGALSFSPDGKYLASGSYDGTICLRSLGAASISSLRASGRTIGS